MQKIGKKRYASSAAKTVTGAVGPLKTRKQAQTAQQQDTWDQARPGVPKGTVADILYIWALGPIRAQSPGPYWAQGLIGPGPREHRISLCWGFNWSPGSSA
jgi:hypothetical protein